jgi:hypothetical protein
MIHEFFKDFVLKFNIRNGELASQEKLNESVNVLKKETDDLYNRSQIVRGDLAFPWQTQTYYKEGEIVSYQGKNYIVIEGQESENEIPSISYKWKETVRADWTMELDPDGYLRVDRTEAYMPTGPYNPAVKKYVDDGDSAFYRNLDLNDGINFMPLDDDALTNIDHITGNGLPKTDPDYIPIYTPSAEWHPANKLYVDNQINELATGGSITVGNTLNSDALGNRPADQYLTLERKFSGNYNGFAVKNGSESESINATDWMRTTSNGLLPYDIFNEAGDEGSSLGNENWKFKNIYGKYGYLDNITSTNGNIKNLSVDNLNAGKFTITDLNMPILSASEGRFDTLIANSVTAPVLNGTASNSLKLDGKDSDFYASKDDLNHIQIPGQLTNGEILAKLITVDGGGSGLDADKVDGLQASQFIRSDTTDTFTDLTGTSINLTSQVKSDKINCKTNQQLVLNAGESDGKVSGQTNEYVYVNAEQGLTVNTPDAGHDNWQSGYSVDTTHITGNSISIKGNKVWHAGNDGSGSGLDADKLDGIDSSSFLRRDLNNTMLWGTYIYESDNQFKITLNNTKKIPHSEIHFNSYINKNSDYGYIRYDDDNDTYNKWGDSTENSALVLGVANDAENAVSDVVALQSPAGIFLNAPHVYVGNKYGHEVWHSGNASFTNHKATNGYQKLPGGIIIQWGEVQRPQNTGQKLTFPISFPNACINASTTIITSADWGESTSVYSLTKTSMYIRNSNGGTLNIYWIAIGY